MKKMIRLVLGLLLVLGLISVVSTRTVRAQSNNDSQPASEPAKASAPAHESATGELVKETREAAGEEEEENANLKHAAPVQWLARKTGMSVHGAHLALTLTNFAIMLPVLYWLTNFLTRAITGKENLFVLFRSRTQSIGAALEEARAASQDANRRLADIENRLRQLDGEIGHMQSTAETEAASEEVRIKNATEEDIRKVVAAAEQEIATAAKQARRDLSAHTASLAIALARQQINVDSNTDQVLVRTFATKLAGKDGN